MHVIDEQSGLIHKALGWPGPALCGVDMPYIGSRRTQKSITCPRCFEETETLEKEMKVRISWADYNRLRAEAHEAELSLSAYIRKILRGDHHE